MDANAPIVFPIRTMLKHITLLTAFFAAFTLSAARVDTVTIATTHIVSPAKAVVITPDSKTQGRLFPSVYILHGYGGAYSDWTNLIRQNLPELADRYGMVMIMPDGRDSWYWDAEKNPEMQMESFFVKDLVPYIDANYPTIKTPDQRAITGLSMGGHGAMWLAIRHSNIWGNAGSMSGGLDIRPFSKKWKMDQALGPIENNAESWDKHTVINLVVSLIPGQLNVTIDCGVDDFFIDVNRNVHKKLVYAKIPHDYSERPGKHNRQYWKNSILYHLLFFNEAFNKASNDNTTSGK